MQWSKLNKKKTFLVLGNFKILKNSNVWNKLQNYWKMYQKKQYNKENDGPEGRSLYCLNLNCRAPPGRLLQSDLTGLVAGCLT